MLEPSLSEYLGELKVKFGFPGSPAGKESACNAGDPGSIPGSGRSPGEGNGYPLQYSCLKKSMDRGAGWARDLSYLCKGPMVFGTGQVPLSEGRGGKGKDQRLVLDDMGHLHVFHC